MHIYSDTHAPDTNPQAVHHLHASRTGDLPRLDMPGGG